ncbi:hypothetical protein ACMXYY_12380 [Acinetobacter courvalinii]
MGIHATTLDKTVTVITMNKKSTTHISITISEKLHSEELHIMTENDFTDIYKSSPVSNSSEADRLSELKKNVAEAKAALDSFSVPRESILYKFKKKILTT